MIEQPGRLLRWFFARFFDPISIPIEVIDRIRRAAQRGCIVYVCRTLSLVDYFYLTYMCWRFDLPRAQFCNGIGLLPLLQLSRLWAWLWTGRRSVSPSTQFSELVEDGQSALLFLRHPRALLDRESADFRQPYFEALLALAEKSARSITLVPLALLWGSSAVRSAQSERSLIDWVFGDEEAPGRVRALWAFLRFFRQSRVLGAEPLEIHDFMASEQAEKQDRNRLARRLRWQVGGRLESEVRVVVGPVRKGSYQLRQEVLRSRRLIETARQIAATEKTPMARLETRARRELENIAADPSPLMFDVLHLLLSVVWRKIFDGFEIDRAGLERVREAARHGPLVLVPSHRSHVDYLVLSYVFIDNGLVPPHIAAGANLSFFPLGFLFRRAGAFFLRRSFGGDKLYAALFEAYVRKLLREGHNIEFFIEGGRSRTGKLLAPKFGLLRMLVDAAIEKERDGRPIHIVPISIGYEKVIEDRSYARELGGGEKQAEDAKGLLRVARVLGGRYGRLNIQFDAPFSLEEALGAKTAWPADDTAAMSIDEVRQLTTQRIAHRIRYGINRVTALTPTALVAAVLLGSGRRGQTHTELLRKATFLFKHAQRQGARLADTLVLDGRLDHDAIARALELLSAKGKLQIRSLSSQGGSENVYVVADQRRPHLAYYRNHAIHFFVDDALVSLAWLSSSDTQGVALTELHQRTLLVSRLLKHEFTYQVGASFAEIFDRTVERLVQLGVLERSGSGERILAAEVELVELLAGQVADFVESYAVAVHCLRRMRRPSSSKELLNDCQERGRRLFLTGEIERSEACARVNYENAIESWKERKLLIQEEGIVLPPTREAIDTIESETSPFLHAGRMRRRA